MVGLLSVGSKVSPKGELIGEQGVKELVAIKQQGEEMGLARLFEKDSILGKGVLDENGLPPFPSGITPGVKGGRRYELTEGEGYPEK